LLSSRNFYVTALKHGGSSGHEINEIIKYYNCGLVIFVKKKLLKAETSSAINVLSSLAFGKFVLRDFANSLGRPENKNMSLEL
jgi:hypothetical protein